MNINRILNILQKICYFLYKNKSPPHRRTLNIYQLRLNKFFNNNALHSVFWCFFIPNRPNFILYFNTFYTFLIFKYQKSITHTDSHSYCCQEQQTGMLSRIELFLFRGITKKIKKEYKPYEQVRKKWTIEKRQPLW